MDLIGPMPYVVLNSMLDEAYPRGARNYWKSHFINELTDQAIDTLVDCYAKCASPMSNLLLEHFHGAATRVPPTATAYALRSEGYNLLFLSQWMDPADDEAGIAWARESYAAAQPHVGSARFLNYMSDDDATDASVGAIYGPNLKRLRELKKTFDPGNVFHQNINITPGA
jgi:FAD/FMN-containing dehydrogenase